MKISDKIRFMRQLKGHSQEEMAEMLGMSLNGYANIERGETDVQVSRLEKIANVFDVNLMELMGFGEKNVLYFCGDNNNGGNNTIFNYQSNMPPETLTLELQKTRFLLEQKEKEIDYLKQIIELLKSDRKSDRNEYFPIQK